MFSEFQKSKPTKQIQLKNHRYLAVRREAKYFNNEKLNVTIRTCDIPRRFYFVVDRNLRRQPINTFPTFFLVNTQHHHVWDRQHDRSMVDIQNRCLISRFVTTAFLVNDES